MNKGNKICIVCPSFHGGGAEKVAINLANYFVSCGYNVDFVVFRAEGPYKNDLSSDIRVFNLDIKKARFATFRYIIPRIRKYLKNEKPIYVLSVIRSANWAIGLATKFRPQRKKMKIMFREANTLDGLTKNSSLRNKALLAMMRRTYATADCIIANSNDTKKDLIAHKIASSKDVQVIGNPVTINNLDLHTLHAPQHNWFKDENIAVVLAAGRLHPQKGFCNLIRAFAIVHKKIPSTRLFILGEGKERDNLKRLLHELKLSEVVSLYGFVDNPYPYYKFSNVFVLSSQWEGFGNVIVEAMSTGTPVVSTDCAGGPRMILKNGEFGNLVHLNDAEALADGIISTLKFPPDPNILIRRSFDFSIQNIGELYLKALTK